MNRTELLRELIVEADNLVFSYSANYGMTKPRAGYETEWERAKERSELLQQMYDEDIAIAPGQVVWRVNDTYDGIEAVTVTNIDHHKDRILIYAHPSRYTWTKDDIGKLVFLTPEEAEAHLKGGN